MNETSTETEICRNGDNGPHPFEMGRDVDDEHSADPRWCNVCGEARQGAVVTAPTSIDPDVHPREDAVTVVREALLAVDPLFVDPHDPDDMDAYATAAVSALMRAGMLDGQVDEVTAERDRYRAALERIAGDGSGLDVFLPVETLQGIAREALGGGS